MKTYNEWRAEGIPAHLAYRWAQPSRYEWTQTGDRWECAHGSWLLVGTVEEDHFEWPDISWLGEFVWSETRPDPDAVRVDWPNYRVDARRGDFVWFIWDERNRWDAAYYRRAGYSRHTVFLMREEMKRADARLATELNGFELMVEVRDGETVIGADGYHTDATYPYDWPTDFDELAHGALIDAEKEAFRRLASPRIERIEA